MRTVTHRGMALGSAMRELVRGATSADRMVLFDFDGPPDERTFTVEVVSPTEAAEHNRVCETCHKPFVSSRRYARFCGTTCRVRAHRASKVGE